jgi:hypothetical protein
MKELWIEMYEKEVENIIEEFDIEEKEAEAKLNAILEIDSGYFYSKFYMEA